MVTITIIFHKYILILVLGGGLVSFWISMCRQIALVFGFRFTG